MKIAVITSGFLPVPPTKGGAVENLLYNLIKENEKEKKFEFEIFSIWDEKAKEVSKEYKSTTCRFIRINKCICALDKLIFWIAKNILKKENSQSYRYIFQRLYYLNICSKLLKNNDYNKVLLENHPTQYLALKWRKNYVKYADSYYYHCHNEFPSTYGCDEIIKNTKKIICVSQFIANSISKIIDVPEQKLVVLRNCIDTDRFSGNISKNEKNELRKKYNIEEHDKVLLFTGRITPEKGVEELVEALRNVKNKNYKLLILGSALNELKTRTNYQEKIENIVKTIPDKIIFTGFIKYEEINKFYSLADIAVLPSIWDDPAPLTIIESLVSGLPIITTNSGGIPEYAKNGSAIILNKDESLISNLAIEIDKLLVDDERIREMSENGIKISKDLTLNNFYNNFFEIIRN